MSGHHETGGGDIGPIELARQGAEALAAPSEMVMMLFFSWLFIWLGGDVVLNSGAGGGHGGH
jgi:hypothetical protein